VISTKQLHGHYLLLVTFYQRQQIQSKIFVKIHFDSFGAVLVVMLSNFCTKSSSVVLHRSEHYFQQQELFEDRQLFCIVNYFCEQFTIIET